MTDNFLRCPDCEVDAVPADEWDRIGKRPLWSEDAEGVCPSCDRLIGVHITDDDDYDCAVATPIVICKKCKREEHDCECPESEVKS